MTSSIHFSDKELSRPLTPVDDSLFIELPKIRTLIQPIPLGYVGSVIQRNDLVGDHTSSDRDLVIASKVDCDRLAEDRSLPSKRGTDKNPYSKKELTELAREAGIAVSQHKGALVVQLRQRYCK